MSDEIVVVRPPERKEHAAEGNILESPIFRLSKHGARPHRGRDKDGKLLKVDEDYQTEIVFRERHEDGTTVQHRLELKADTKYGFPTMLGNRILFALIREAKRLGLKSPKIPCTRADICRWIEVKPGGRWYQLVERQLDAMKKMELKFYDSWWNGSEKSYYPGVRSLNLINEYRFPPMVAKRNKEKNEQLGLGFENWVELGTTLFESLKSYLMPFDLSYMNKLPSETAQRLYAYLSKRAYQKRSYQERLVSLAPRLPLAKRAPSAIQAALEPACQELVTPLGPNNVRLLESYEFDGEGRDTLLRVWFEGTSPIEQLRASLGGHQRRPQFDHPEGG